MNKSPLIALNFTLIMISLLCLETSYASGKAESSSSKEATKAPESTIEQFIPESFKKSSTGAPASIGNGIGYLQEPLRLGNKKKQDSVAVLYHSNDRNCELRILSKVEKKWTLQSPTILQVPDQIQYCVNVASKDLDQDGIDELTVEVAEGRETNPPVILRWNGNHMQDITPMKERADGSLVSVLRTVAIADKPVNNKLLIIDYQENDPNADRRIFELRNGKIELQGAYDFVSFLGAQKNSYSTLNPKFNSEAQYVLSISNISEHKRAVRAEVIVNGVVVLKPQDFCESPPPKKSQKEFWQGNDDEDDKDEDRCKRCKPKEEVYAIVNLKTSNEIKVKVYGRKDSKIQFSLVKKP